MTAAARACCGAIVLAALLAARTVEPPEWVASCLTRSVPESSDRPSISILHEELMVDVSARYLSKHVRQAVRIRTAEGLHAVPLAAAQAINEDFRLIGAWKVRPDGVTSEYGSEAVTVRSAHDRLNFSMTKLNTFDPAEARVGDVIAWEFTLRSRPDSHYVSWVFGGDIPTAMSRFGIRTPADWAVQTAFLNEREPSPTVDLEGYRVWTLTELPGIPPEPSRPPLRNLAPTIVAAGGAAHGPGRARSFSSWQGVGAWYASIAARQAVPDASVRAAGAEIAAGAPPGLLTIRAVTRFVQGMRYLNLAVGRSVAEPHAASEILKNRFGDCEDKAILTIALLGALGVKAYPVLALTRDGGTVVEALPSPNQFNHAIVAIESPPESSLLSTVDAGPLGRLIVFDPTDSGTGLGDLPYYLQGTVAVIAHATEGRLVTLPDLPPEESSRRSDLRIVFGDGGLVNVSGRVVYTGQYAAAERERLGSVTATKRRADYLATLTQSFGTAELSAYDVSGVESPGEPLVVTIDLRLASPGLDLADVRTLPAAFALPSRAPRFHQSERRLPLFLEDEFLEEDAAIIELPAGWKCEARLPDVVLEAPGGQYSIKASLVGGNVEVQRRLLVRGVTIPPGEYAAARALFEGVPQGDGTAIVLHK